MFLHVKNVNIFKKIKDSNIDNIYNFKYIDKTNYFLKSIDNPIYIFGATPISLYFASMLDDKSLLKRFLDEDNLKVNKFYLGKIVRHPKDVINVVSFIPLNQAVIEKIKIKYPKIDFMSTNKIDE